MTILSAEGQAKVQLWRQKCRDNTITKEELREALSLLQQERGRTAQATGGSRTTKARGAGKPNSDDLLSELDNI